MPEPPLAARAAAAAHMLLAPPDAVLLAALASAAEGALEQERATQDFYDFLCVPQSGCYIPAYPHVLSRGTWNGEYWNFPAPRHYGGDALRPLYAAAGFDPAALDADPLIAGGNRPLDYAGFVLAFLSGLLDTASDEPSGAMIVRDFIVEQFGGWIDLLAELLRVSGSPYLSLVGEGIRELTDELRADFVPAAPEMAPEVVG
jgi:hypothetical protein